VVHVFWPTVNDFEKRIIVVGINIMMDKIFYKEYTEKELVQSDVNIGTVIFTDCGLSNGTIADALE